MPDRDPSAAPQDIEQAALTRLKVSVDAPGSLPRAVTVLGSERAAWLGDRVGDGAHVPAGMERYLVDLKLPIGERSPIVTFSKAAYVDVGPATATAETVSVEVSWRAAGMAPLFPVFSGRLTWSGGRLTVRGLYEPPGGGMGVVADRLLLSVAARGTARWLLGEIAERMAGSSETT